MTETIVEFSFSSDIHSRNAISTKNYWVKTQIIIQPWKTHPLVTQSMKNDKFKPRRNMINIVNITH